MEYTIQEMKAMQNIVSAILFNMRFKGSMRISKVYNIDDFDIATMEKWSCISVLSSEFLPMPTG